MSGTTKKFLVENFANIAIALSVIFLIFELNQNRRMMERELVFMEAQAYQGRAELAFEMSQLAFEHPDLCALRDQYSINPDWSEIDPSDRQALIHYHGTFIKVMENTYFQIRQGLITRELWGEVVSRVLRRFGQAWLDLEISMDPELRVEVERTLSEMNGEDGSNQSVS